MYTIAMGFSQPFHVIFLVYHKRDMSKIRYFFALLLIDTVSHVSTQENAIIRATILTATDSNDHDPSAKSLDQ